MELAIVIIIAFILSGVLWFGYFYYREKRLLDRLSRMMDQAEEGELRIQDISEEKLSELENRFKRYLDDSMMSGEVQQRQKEIIQGLISDISHQTLTPISNLKIYSELLAEEAGGDLTAVETIYEQTEKLDFLIQSMVKLSRMESGIIAVHPEPTDVRLLFEMIQQEYGYKAKEKGIILCIEDTDLQAVTDLKWTVEAVGNIVDNAVKYTDEGGRVIIKAEEYSFFIRINIEDNGIGLEEEEIPQIFSRFYRSSKVANQPGVGIGLYLAREIIQQQKGYIKVMSQKGRGTVFSVFLPRTV